MKNNKESKLLLFLLAFMLIYGFYTYLLKPKVEANNELEKEIEKEEEQLLSMYTKAGTYNAKVNTLHEHQDTLRKQSSLFYSKEDQQEEFLNLIHGFLMEEELQLVSIKSSDYASSTGEDYPGAVSPYTVYFAEGDKFNMRDLETEAGAKYPRVDRMEIEFVYTGEYENMKSFLESLRDTEKFTISNNMEIAWRIDDYPTPVEEEDEENSSRPNNPATDEEEEEVEPSNQLTLTVEFYRLDNLVALSVQPQKFEGNDVVVPQDVANGDYKKMYTPANLGRAIKSLFSGDDKQSDNGDKQ